MLEADVRVSQLAHNVYVEFSKVLNSLKYLLLR